MAIRSLCTGNSNRRTYTSAGAGTVPCCPQRLALLLDQLTEPDGIAKYTKSHVNKPILVTPNELTQYFGNVDRKVSGTVQQGDETNEYALLAY